MKSFIAFLLVIVLLSCGDQRHTGYQDDYQVIRGENGQQMVIVRDDNGAEMLMNYMMFQSLMNQGGYNSVRNYYSTNRGAFIPYSGQYRSWNRTGTVRTNSFDYYKRPTNVTTQQSRTGYTPSYNNRVTTTPSSSSSFRTKEYNRNTYSDRPSSSFRKGPDTYSKPSYSSGSSYSRPSSTSSFRNSSSSSTRSSTTSSFRK